MNTVLDGPARSPSASPAQRLQREMTAVRVSFTWMGVSKTLSTEQKSEAAETFGAEGRVISAGKKLIDSSHPAFRAVTAVRSKAVQYWKSMSLPYPEPGVRLIRRESVEPFQEAMTGFRDELTESVGKLQGRFAELKEAARLRLGRLFNPADYPTDLSSLFSVTWDFPAVEPPDYLRQLSPEVFEQERARVAARFDEAVQLAEQAFIDELGRLVEHLVERLSGSGPDGKSKVFRDSAVTNLGEFFERFKSLNVRSNAQLDELVQRAQQTVRGLGAQTLRDNAGLRQQVASQMSAVQSVLDGLLVDRPRRNILRQNRNGEPTAG